MQPLSHEEILCVGEKVLKLPDTLMPHFVRCMEETDNAVLFDYYADVKQKTEAAKKKKGPRGKKQ